MQKRRQKITPSLKNKKKSKSKSKKIQQELAMPKNFSNQSLQSNSLQRLVSFNSDNKIYKQKSKNNIFDKSYFSKVSKLKDKLLNKSPSENLFKKSIKKLSQLQSHKKQKTLIKKFTNQKPIDYYSDYSVETQKIEQSTYILLKPEKKEKQTSELNIVQQSRQEDLRLKFLLDKCRQFKLLDEEIKRKDNSIREQSKIVTIIFQKKQAVQDNNEQVFEDNLDNFVNKISEEQFSQTLQTFEFNKIYFNSTIFQDEEFLLGFLEQLFQLILKDQQLKKYLKNKVFQDFTLQQYNFEPILPINLFWKVIKEFDKDYAEEKFFQYYCKMIFDSLNQELDIKRFEYFYHCQTYQQFQNIKKSYFTFGYIYQEIINKMTYYDTNKIRYDESSSIEVIQDLVLNEILADKDVFQLEQYESNEIKENLSSFVFDYLVQDLILDFFSNQIKQQNKCQNFSFYSCRKKVQNFIRQQILLIQLLGCYYFIVYMQIFLPSILQ